MPRYHIHSEKLDTWIEVTAEDGRNFWERFGDMTLRELMQQVELDLSDPKMIVEEKPLDRIRPFLRPVA